MARGTSGTPRAAPQSSAASTGKKQQSIAGFFQKRPLPTPSASTPGASSNVDAASSPVALTDVSQQKENVSPGALYSSPSRSAKKHVNYAESDAEEDEDEVFKPLSGNRRAAKRRRISVKDDSESDDEFGLDAGTQAAMEEREDSEELPSVSTAQQWKFDPQSAFQVPQPSAARKPKYTGPSKPQKAHKTDPSDRYTWLAHMLDADRNPPDHPDYDPRTLYIPPLELKNLSAFEQQYWAIKSKFMDTIVFFKKGKFYELYEMDATIGHQLFDLKLTDRVNMRMVGVPEASLEMWANQFIAKGYKIARVDQMESKLGKDMREKQEGKASKTTKKEIINRELAAVLTSGTLVEGNMLQDDMATYCAAIKETEHEGKPVFGIAFVDTATAQFQLSEFVDDVDMTRFETFVAQIRPGELLLEKGCISAKALRILKNNTPPTTIMNYLKPDKEFLTAEKTRMTFNGEGYFDKKVKNVDEESVHGDGEDALSAGEWPAVLQEAKEKELVFPALGALVWYLTLLKIERDLITCGNFSWYDPIRKSSTLVLDGQSLINLEIFANTFDGTAQGTLFTMLNRCITPFGKRMLKQWVCHPLSDAIKINQRFDAIDALKSGGSVMDSFTSSLSRLPDLERLISRIHAGRCKPQDFVKVLDGFEQIDYTMSLLSSFETGNGLLHQLIAAMPDLRGALAHWNDAFDRVKAKDEGLFIPQPDVEADFDESQAQIDEVLAQLEKLLARARRDLGSSSIKFTDNGKEIYQLEVPIKVKGNIPKNWKQMSATKQCKRWYSPELEDLVQKLKEAQETHGQVLKNMASRYFARFDIDYPIWLAAVKIVAQLDCLISLAKVSGSMGTPACRPEFVEDDDARSILEFKTLRHPCIETTTNFIPNDISLGGDNASINLLTGANAAGKSTVLRMTCIAVILAQVGCYVPCESARMTPVDRIMSRLGAHDNIFAGQSTFMVELSETKKILSEATPRSLVILDELGRGTSSYDGVAVAQAVLHHIATQIGSLGYFATHYHSLAAEFQHHPEIAAKRMAVRVEHDIRDVTFLYQLEDGVAEGSYGMHCAAMCGISDKIIDRAEQAAQSWEHTGRIKESLEKAQESNWLPLGLLSDVSWILKDGDGMGEASLEVLRKAIAAL